MAKFDQPRDEIRAHMPAAPDDDDPGHSHLPVGAWHAGSDLPITLYHGKSGAITRLQSLLDFLPAATT
jgi:hypothetical protein